MEEGGDLSEGEKTIRGIGGSVTPGWTKAGIQITNDDPRSRPTMEDRGKSLARKGRRGINTKENLT